MTKAPPLDFLARVDGQDWMAHGCCVGTTGRADDPFYDDLRGRGGDRAKRLCLACPVRAECLRYALGNREQHGVWGGLTPEERAATRRDAPSAELPVAAPWVPRRVPVDRVALLEEMAALGYARRVEVALDSAA